MNKSATMMVMENDFDVLFRATVWELDLNDCIAYNGNAYFVNEIQEVEGGYKLLVTEQTWSEDDELFLRDDEIVDVIRPDERY